MPSISRSLRSAKAQKFSAAGLGIAGAAALAATVVPAGNASADSARSAAGTVDAKPAAVSDRAPIAQTQSLGASNSSLVSAKTEAGGEKRGSVAEALAADEALNGTIAAKTQAESRAKADVVKKKEAAEKKAAAEREGEETSRSGDRKADYPNNLDGWIREARAIMQEKGIPGSYEGIHRNIIRESGGDPQAINNWDINAQNGVPSKGLLQVIQPTFDAYHVEGTDYDLYDPVANIVAACNYAADRYGSMDNVDSAY